MITYKYSFNEKGNIIMAAKPKMTKAFVLHLKKMILIELIKLMKFDNYNHDKKYEFAMKIGKKTKNVLCEAFDITYDNEGNLEFYIKEITDEERQYKINIDKQYMLELLEFVSELECEEEDKLAKTAIIEKDKIIKDFDDSKIHAPNLDNIKEFILQLIGKKTVVKSIHMKNVGYPSKNGEILTYTSALIKINANWKASLKFRYNKEETFRILIDSETFLKIWKSRKEEKE